MTTRIMMFISSRGRGVLLLYASKSSVLLQVIPTNSSFEYTKFCLFNLATFGFIFEFIKLGSSPPVLKSHYIIICYVMSSMLLQGTIINSSFEYTQICLFNLALVDLFSNVSNL